MSVEARPPAADPMADEFDIAGRPDARLGRAGRIAGSGWWVAVAVVVFLSLSLAQIVQSPGMHYDEAILVQGAVRMLTSPDKPTFAHDAGSWIPLGKRWWPLMTMPYVGAVKSYLMLLPFAVFGTRLSVARVVAALLAAFGIFGIASLLRRHVSGAAGAAFALILAIHPAFVDLNAFDQGSVPLWMATLGLICLAVVRYERQPTRGAALLVGLATGVAVWARLNFVWFLLAVAAGALLSEGRRVVPPLQNLRAFLCGGLVGAAPLLVFEGTSRLVTLDFIRAVSLRDPLIALLRQRWHDLSEIFVSDGQLRAMWAGPPVPTWERYAIALVVGFLLVVGLARSRNEQAGGDRWGRPAGLALLFNVAIVLTSRLPIHQHHLVTTLPLVALVCVLGFCRLFRRSRRWRPVAVAVGGGYLVLALWWNVAAIRGLHRTGGVERWSDALTRMTEYLEARHSGDQVEVLDWGFANSVNFLSNGRTRLNEVFGGATLATTAAGQPWSSIVAAGGVFLAFDERAADLKYFPAATAGFRAALAAAGARYTRTPFFERRGRPCVEVLEVEPAAKAPVSP